MATSRLDNVRSIVHAPPLVFVRRRGGRVRHQVHDGHREKEAQKENREDAGDAADEAVA